MSAFTMAQSIMFSNTTDVSTAVSQGMLTITSVGTQEFYECVVCHRSMAGRVPAESHLMGGPHFKALKNHKFAAPLSDAVSKIRIEDDHSTHTSPSSLPSYDNSSSDYALIQAAMQSNVVKEVNVGGVIHTTCMLCNVTCTGDVPMAQHLKGEPHRKRQRRMPDHGSCEPDSAAHSTGAFELSSQQSRVSTSFDNIPTYTTSGDSSDVEDVQKALREGILTRDTTGGVETFTCVLCSKSCTGEIPMSQHLRSNGHLKKSSRGRLATSVPDPPRTVPDLVPPRPTMPMTNISSNYFNPRENQQPKLFESDYAPMESKPSPASLRIDGYQIEKDCVESAKEEGIVYEEEGLLVCSLCQRTCTGKVNMIEHLKGEDHHKMFRNQLEWMQVLDGVSQSSDVSSPHRESRSPSLNFSLSTKGGPVLVPRPNIESSRQSSPISSSSNSSLSNECVSATNGRGGVSMRIDTHLPENLKDVKIFYPDDPLTNL